MADNQIEVLLIDDEEADAELFTRAVQKSGVNVRVHSVTDAWGGIEYISGRGIYRNRLAFPLPDLVVFGLLRDDSGLDFVKWCRGTDLGKCLPLVLLTAAPEGDERISKALEYGANGVFFKTGTLRALRQVVQEIVDLVDRGQQTRAE